MSVQAPELPEFLWLEQVQVPMLAPVSAVLQAWLEQASPEQMQLQEPV